MEQESIFWEYLRQLEVFCSYQERCQNEIEEKMKKLAIPEPYKEALIEKLLADKAFNNLRYATAFAKGKLSYKKWGKQKIYKALRLKGVLSADIYAAISQLDEDLYMSILTESLEKKQIEIGGVSELRQKKRLLNFGLQRGYESNYIWDYINRNSNENNKYNGN